MRAQSACTQGARHAQVSKSQVDLIVIAGFIVRKVWLVITRQSVSRMAVRCNPIVDSKTGRNGFVRNTRNLECNQSRCSVTSQGATRSRGMQSRVSGRTCAVYTNQMI